MTIQAAAPMFLYNLTDPTGTGDFEFKIFPRQIDTDDSANWEELDVAGFKKPLNFANSDPQKIEIGEAWLDNTATGLSVLPDIERLRSLMQRGTNGAPPVLQLICGEWTVVVILKNLKTERTRFTNDNTQVRAKLSLTFWEVQTEGRAPALSPPGSRPEDAKFSF